MNKDSHVQNKVLLLLVRSVKIVLVYLFDYGKDNINIVEADVLHIKI